MKPLSGFEKSSTPKANCRTEAGSQVSSKAKKQKKKSGQTKGEGRIRTRRRINFPRLPDLWRRRHNYLVLIPILGTLAFVCTAITGIVLGAIP